MIKFFAVTALVFWIWYQVARGWRVRHDLSTGAWHLQQEAADRAHL